MIADSGEWGTFAWAQLVLGTPGGRIAGGSDEVMRNIVGERVLGLPKDAGIDSTSPFRDLKVGTLGAALVGAVEALPPAFRAAFLLREIHGLTYEEISEALHVDMGTVRSRLARARGLLQRMLAAVHDD
jgi:DNA-directed RNA polymerase specialized sigma24 family protein